MDNLSQEEIDALLEEAADEIEETPAVAPAAERAPRPADEPPRDAALGWRNFDFHRPNNNLSRGFERNLRGVSEGLSKDASLVFSNLLRGTCDFTFAGITVNSFGESLSTWENPSCIAICGLEPLQGPVLMHVDASLMFSFFTKLLGGPIEEPSQVRDFTEIETGMARRLLTKVLELFAVSCEKLARLEPVIAQIENNPNYLNAFSESEAVLVLQYNVTVESVGGLVSLVLPLAAFEPVRSNFDPKEGVDLRSSGDRAVEKDKARRLVGEAKATLAATFRPLDMDTSRLLALEVGDVVELDHHVDRPLDVAIEGRTLFVGASGKVGRTRAIRIVGRKEEA